MKSLMEFVCRIIDTDGKGITRGTGFFIHPDGYVATCYHVVHACKRDIGIGIFGELKPIVSKIVMQDEDHDIAVLNIDRKKCKFLPLNSECDLGDNIFSHGFSIQHLPTFPDGFPVKSTLTGTWK